MKKQFLLILLTVFISGNAVIGQISIEQSMLFSVDKLKADLAYLKSKLEIYHPGLYLYTNKSEIDRTFDSLQNDLTKPLSETGFYKHITIISSIIKDGHTIILPSEKITNAQSNITGFLPYHFVIVNGKLFVDMVYTSDHVIAAGAEVLTINNDPASDVIKQLGERQVRDGENQTYPTWIVSNYFRQYFSFVFGHAENFTMSYNLNGQTSVATIKALSRDSIYFYRQKNYPAKIFSNLPNDGIKLKIETEKKYALLTIKDFHNDVLKNEYKQNFEKVIRSCFEQISNSKTENLILDIRNNQGGDIENGVELLAFLLDQPFSVVQAYFCVDKNELQKCHGPSLGLHNSKSMNFKGKLYVLINGGSFSNSGIVSSCLQAHNRATFIGQETGGNPNVIAGFINDIKLPNTGIQVQVPTKQFVITDKTTNKGHGVIPTQLIEPKLADILEGKDTELDYTIELISKSKADN